MSINYVMNNLVFLESSNTLKGLSLVSG